MGPSHTFVEFYFQKLHQVLTMNIKDQSPVLPFQWWEGERNHFKICTEHFVVLNTSLPLREVILLEPNLHG